MSAIKVMVNGIPGNMASHAARHVLDDPRFELLPYSLTGPEIEADHHRIGAVTVALLRPDRRESTVRTIMGREGPFIGVDYTHPLAVNDNVEFYCTCGIPFVIGTTGGDKERLVKTIRSSRISAVVAPNMAKQIVGFQAMMEYAATTFPDLFKGYVLQIKESHQKGKADTSGTAKAMVSYFTKMGICFSEEDIEKERDPQVQKMKLGVPEPYLNGHGWHTYTLTSEDKTVRFEFTHNVNGRDVYAKGTLDAIVYLKKKIDEKCTGRVFTMIDVLKGI